MKNCEIINRRKGSQNKGRSRVGLLTESFSVFSVGRCKSHEKNEFNANTTNNKNDSNINNNN